MSDSNHQGGETLATLAINLLPIKRHWMAIRSSTDDAHLVQEAARGNQVAFRQLYERYYRPMASVIFRVGGTFVDVDDVLQDVFLRAWNGLPGFRQDAQFSTWLYRIAVNTALRHREKRKARAQQRRHAKHCWIPRMLPSMRTRPLSCARRSIAWVRNIEVL